MSKRYVWPVSGLLSVVLIWFWYKNTTIHIHRSEFENQQNSFRTSIQPNTSQAIQVSAADLMARPLAKTSYAHPKMPKYIHQSWKDGQLDAKMSRWSSTCRAVHADWEWILWTDDDNLAMVREYFPWLVPAYLALPEEINRADAARNMYMYLFGGMYADLDTECLGDMSRLFASYGVSVDVSGKTAGGGGHQEESTIGQGVPVAFLGRMDYDMTDDTLLHTVPNAWMASTAGHPFWLFVLQNLRAQIESVSTMALDTMQTEDITGPMALYRDLQLYATLVDKGVDAGDLLAKDSSWDLFDRDSVATGVVVPKIEILPAKTIYPFAWNNADQRLRRVCIGSRLSFDSERCKAAVVTDETYAITYWTHSWE